MFNPNPFIDHSRIHLLNDLKEQSAHKFHLPDFNPKFQNRFNSSAVGMLVMANPQRAYFLFDPPKPSFNQFPLEPLSLGMPSRSEPKFSSPIKPSNTSCSPQKDNREKDSSSWKSNFQRNMFVNSGAKIANYNNQSLEHASNISPLLKQQNAQFTPQRPHRKNLTEVQMNLSKALHNVDEDFIFEMPSAMENETPQVLKHLQHRLAKKQSGRQSYDSFSKQNTEQSEQQPQKSIRRMSLERLNSAEPIRMSSRRRKNLSQSLLSENTVELKNTNNFLFYFDDVQVTQKKRSLASVCWLLVLPCLIKKEARRKYTTRKVSSIATFQSNYNDVINSLKFYFLNSLSDQLEQIFTQTTSICLVQRQDTGFFGKKRLSNDTLQNRVQKSVNPIISNLFQSLFGTLRGTRMPEHVISFLCSISENGCVPPPEFYTDFELRRLSFSALGSLKYLHPQQSKMVLGVFVLGKVLLHRMLLHPQEEMAFGPKLDPKNRKAKRNVKMIASILFIILEDIIKSTAEVNLRTNPQSLQRVPAIKGGRLVLGESKEDEEAMLNQKFDSDSIIQGLYSKEELGYYFKARQDDVKAISCWMMKWIDELYAITNEYYLANGSKYRQTKRLALGGRK